MVGGTYLILEKTEKEIGQGFKTFKDIQRNDANGLIITRTFPDKILKKYNLGRLPVIWLSRSKNKNAISPTNLGALIEDIKEFTKKNENSIIMFDGLEYLTVHNEFDRVLKFLHSLEDEIAMERSRLIISLNPKTLSDKKVALLSKEMKILSIEQRDKNTN
jgi:archaellum biogenesis ATPase FlaH